MATKSQYQVNKKVKGKKDEGKGKIDKKLLFGAVFFILFMTITAISQTSRQIKMTGSEANQVKRPQIAGLDIPREVMERVQKLKSTQDRENVIKEWAASEGITFKYKKDGTYIAIRDGQEYVMREADPDYVPTEDNADDDNDDNQFKENYDEDSSLPKPDTDSHDDHDANAQGNENQ